MRIAIVNHGLFPLLLGGMERHTVFLAENLQQLGQQVDVVVPRLTDKQRDEWKQLGFKFNLIECDWPQTPLWLYSNYLYSHNVKEYLQKVAYDCVYCQGFNAWAYLQKLKLGKRAPCIYNPHGMEMFKTQGLLQTVKHYPMRYAARLQARYAELTVSLGGGLTAEVQRFLEIPHDRITVLPNGIAFDYLQRYQSTAPAQKPSATTQFLFVGRLEHNKGVDILCRAFAGVTSAKLSIVGSGPLEQSLKHRYGNVASIEFLGRLDDGKLFPLYKQVDCLVFASLYEGMPTVILEAMASSKPVIATDIGAVRTMVDSSNGVIVPPDDVASLQQALQHFVVMPAPERRCMEEAAYQRAQTFAWPKIAAQTLTVMQQLKSKFAPSGGK